MTQVSDLNFTSPMESSFGPGNPVGFSYGLPASFDPSWQSPQLTASALGETLTGSVSGSAGISGNISFTAGSYSLSYPVEVNANFPTSVEDGKQFTIDTSSYSVTGADLNMTGPGLAASLSVGIQGAVDVSASGPFLNHSFNIPLSDIDSFSLNSPVELFGDNPYGNVAIAVPAPFAGSSSKASATASLPPVTASGEGAPFVDANLELANLAATAVDVPPYRAPFSALTTTYSRLI